MSITNAQRTREALLRHLSRLARRSLFGTLSETYRTCGRRGLPLSPGAQARPSPLREFSRAERHHHRLLRASSFGRLHARGRGGLARIARGAAGTGGTEPAAPVGAPGRSRSEEERWFGANTRNLP